MVREFLWGIKNKTVGFVKLDGFDAWLYFEFESRGCVTAVTDTGYGFYTNGFFVLTKVLLARISC